MEEARRIAPHTLPPFRRKEERPGGAKDIMPPPGLGFSPLNRGTEGGGGWAATVITVKQINSFSPISASASGEPSARSALGRFEAALFGVVVSDFAGWVIKKEEERVVLRSPSYSE